jgi:major membrane immunogen (membrane-anchored lipoprotein)
LENLLSKANAKLSRYIMSKCPNCGNSNNKPVKTWKHGIFTANAHICGNFKTEYINYFDKKEKHKFTIKVQKGKSYIKA